MTEKRKMANCDHCSGSAQYLGRIGRREIYYCISCKRRSVRGEEKCEPETAGPPVDESSPAELSLDV